MSASTIIGSDRVIARIKGLPAALRPRIMAVVTTFAMDVTKLTKLKLSDNLLHVRTGRLRRSITPKVTESQIGITGVVGTNVVYARPLELGFKGQVSVRSFVRNQKMAFGRSITPRAVTVRASTRNVDIKARKFLQIALEETSPPLVERLRKMGAMP